MNLAAIARVYELKLSTPDDKYTKFAYMALVRECAYQYRAIQESDVTIVYTNTNPYSKSEELFNDIKTNRLLKVYTGGAKHPLMTWQENNVFRAVHDYYGHYMPLAGFGPKGEEMAWRAQRRMFSLAARPALDTETIGQAAVYFCGSKPGHYAQQKAFCFPSAVLEEA